MLIFLIGNLHLCFQKFLFIYPFGPLKNAPKNGFNDAVHFLCTVCSGTVTLFLVLGSVVALIDCDALRVV